MESHEYLALLVVLGLVAIVLLIFLKQHSARRESIDWLDVILVWPMIFKLDKRSKRPTSTRFVIIGILVYLAIVILNIKFR